MSWKQNILFTPGRNTELDPGAIINPNASPFFTPQYLPHLPKDPYLPHARTGLYIDTLLGDRQNNFSSESITNFLTYEYKTELKPITNLLANCFPSNLPTVLDEKGSGISNFRTPPLRYLSWRVFARALQLGTPLAVIYLKLRPGF